MFDEKMANRSQHPVRTGALSSSGVMRSSCVWLRHYRKPVATPRSRSRTPPAQGARARVVGGSIPAHRARRPRRTFSMPFRHFNTPQARRAVRLVAAHRASTRASGSAGGLGEMPTRGPSRSPCGGGQARRLRSLAERDDARAALDFERRPILDHSPIRLEIRDNPEGARCRGRIGYVATRAEARSQRGCGACCHRTRRHECGSRSLDVFAEPGSSRIACGSRTQGICADVSPYPTCAGLPARR